MTKSTPPYVPALGWHALTGYYDRLLGSFGIEQRLRGPLIAYIARKPPRHLLDLGCGTGTQLTVLAARLPELPMLGIDLDEQMLQRARRRLSTLAHVQLQRSDITALDLPAACFDLVVSTLVFHHLLPEQKRSALGEVRRVLEPGGHFLLYDWDRPRGFLPKLGFPLVRLLDGTANTQAHAEGLLPQFLAEAGFVNVETLWHQNWPLGTMTCWSARKPDNAL